MLVKKYAVLWKCHVGEDYPGRHVFMLIFQTK